MRLKYGFLFLAMSSWLLSGCHKEDKPMPDPWQKVSVSNNQTAIYDMTDVYFSSSQVGWISGGVDKELLGNPVLLKTTDGGATWHSIDLQGLQISRFIAFYPVNDQILYACASDKSLVLGSPRKWCKSMDGGSTWQVLPTNILNSFRLFFFDEQTGLSANISTLDKTTDGGITWHTVYREDLSGLDKLQIFGTGIGYAAGTSGFPQRSVGILLKTTDQGNTWQKIPWSYGGISTLSFLNERIGFIGTLEQRLFKTVDGGASWSLIDKQKPNASRGIFMSEQEGFCAAAAIEHTADGGLSWQAEHTIPTSDTFSAIGFSPAGVGIAVTNGGLILKR